MLPRPPHPSRRDDDALARMREVGYIEGRLHRLGIELAHDGSERHTQHQVLPVAAMTTRTTAMSGTLRPEMVLEAVVDERGELGVRLEDDASAVAAVTAVRSALGDEGLAAKRHAPRTSVATLDVDPA